MLKLIKLVPNDFESIKISIRLKFRKVIDNCQIAIELIKFNSTFSMKLTLVGDSIVVIKAEK